MGCCLTVNRRVGTDLCEWGIFDAAKHRDHTICYPLKFQSSLHSHTAVCQKVRTRIQSLSSYSLRGVTSGLRPLRLRMPSMIVAAALPGLRGSCIRHTVHVSKSRQPFISRNFSIDFLCRFRWPALSCLLCCPAVDPLKDQNTDRHQNRTKTQHYSERSAYQNIRALSRGQDLYRGRPGCSELVLVFRHR